MADPARLLERLDEFTAFARKRLADPDLAAEAVQESFLKALAHGGQLLDEERAVAWFYRILRNVIVDLRRRRNPAALPDGDEPAAREADTAIACRCVAALIEELPAAAANALRRVDLEGASIVDAAAAEGITPGALKVRRHRAREQLRELVHATCRTCATHGCVDCTCRQPS
jgi:RNA polymerase sigma-70 factor (ECF subfamily)